MRFMPARIFTGSLAALAALALCLDGLPALAGVPVQNMQTEGETPTQSGPPGVARISAAEGRVDVRRSDTGDAYLAVLNAPVGVGDYLTTRAGARAEVEFDYASLLRLAPGTQIRFTQLDPHAHVLQVAQGTVELRVLRGLDAHPEVQTPSALIQPSARGSYRITVTQAGNTEITVRSGRAAVGIDGTDGMRDLLPGSTLLVTGDGNHARAKNVAVVASADFDRWSDARDARFANVDDWAYVDSGMVGAADLGQYGEWVDSSDYGQVWEPNDVPDGWSPYTDGTWTWQPYYGWTWIGYEPWGYAPYHYGRWFYAGRWCWYPGPFNAFSPFVYAPALVAFFGFGFGFGNIGWVALGPYEPYHPWYGRGRGGRHGYGWNGNVARAYRNAGAPGGAVAVRSSNFASGRFDHIEAVRAAQLRGATSFLHGLPVASTAHDLMPARDSRASGDAVSPRFATFAAVPVRVAAPPARATIATHGENADGARAATERPEMLHPVNADSGASIWSRFGASARTTTEDAIARQSPLVVRDENADRAGTGIWSRFGNQRGASDRIPSYATERSVEAPERSFSFTGQTYGYDRSSADPVRTYGAPPRDGYEPQRSYAMPERSYAMPERSYAMPERSYAMPERSYAMPSYGPARASAGGYGGGSAGRRR